ncbi:MAG: amino acid adenylation domain-containing protein [Acidobacteriota bacterium]|nr:amino acid adenylation domain-containing protein [Acidobacteriota bacterium]
MAQSYKSSLLTPRRKKLLGELLKQEGVGLVVDENIQPRKPDQPLLLSYAQERLWFMDQFQPDNPVYNVIATIQIQGPLHMRALRRSIAEITRRHEVLRTTFRTEGGRPVQVIAPSLETPLPIVDLQGLAPHLLGPETRRLTTMTFRRPFDLAVGPVFRILILSLRPTHHQLVLTMHHIISDARTMEIFSTEFQTLYQHFSEGRTPNLPELPIQYADYALWQRGWLTGKRLDEQISFWKSKLTSTRVLELPRDPAPPGIESFSGALFEFHLSSQLSRDIIRLGHEEGTTPFMTLLTAFKVLLFRYTGEPFIAVGTPVNNRTRAEVEGLIGFFVNTLVISTDASEPVSFREYLSLVRKVSLDAYAHQDLPFEKLVEKMQPERNLNHNPLFQAFFTLQKFLLNVAGEGEDTQAEEQTNEQVESREVTTGRAKFDLSLMMKQTPRGFGGGFEYRLDLFHEDRIGRMVRHFKNLLSQMIKHPDQDFRRLPMLTDEERTRLLINLADTEHEYSQGRSFLDLFQGWAATCPKATAVAFGTEQLTYRMLDERSNQLAWHLKKNGVGPDVLVGVFMERSIDMIVGLLGILKAGGAYLPFDPSYPEERLRYIITETRVPIILTSGEWVGMRLAPETRALWLASQWDLISKNSTKSPRSGTLPDNLAYLIYTSGSTGSPKGVAVNHRLLSNLITWQLACEMVKPGQKTLQYTALNFDVSFQEIFTTLCSGGTLVMISEEDRRDVKLLVQRLDDASVDRLFLPFIALQQIAEAGSRSKRFPKTLGHVITAGEQLQATSAVRALFHNCRALLANQYGPSETHVVSEYLLSSAPDEWSLLPPIGRPIHNTRLYILDAFLNLQPSGIPGDLYVGGLSPARGYFQQPALTAERFVPDPFNRMPGMRMYQTGDRCCFREGQIEFLGRRDEQVKIRGYRIEPGEVEATLVQHSAVLEAAVVSYTTPSGQNYLAAYFVALDEIEVHELRDYLATRLPEYMIPAHFSRIEALPRTPSGKVARRALPEPKRSRAELQVAFLAPRTLAESIIADIWCQVLGLPQTGVRDNFFDLGGHSLTATQVVSRLRDVFGIDLPLAVFFEKPTICELVPAILQSQIEWIGDEKASPVLNEVETLSQHEVDSTSAKLTTSIRQELLEVGTH